MAGKELTASEVRAITAPGKHRVSPNLYLFIASGRRSWMFRGTLNGRPVWRGLGATRIVPLREACAATLKMRLDLHHGRLPDRRVRAKACPSFEEMASEYIAAHESGWRDKKAASTWRNSLKQHAGKLAKLPVDAIEARDVAAALKAVWHASPSTAKKVRNRVAVVLDFARAAGHRSGENPATWKGQLEHLLPSLSTKVKHHDAVAVDDIPSLTADLMARTSVSAKALLFTLLTACRTGDTIGATWAEIDLDAKVWSMLEGRTKAGRPFRIPLSDAVVAILEALPRREGFLFSAGTTGKPLSNMAMLKLMRDLRGHGSTVHGLRSSFRDWASETGKPDEVVEKALDHQRGDAVYAAYARSELLDARRELMSAWAAYATRTDPPKRMRVGSLTAERRNKR
jgi:integrase